jgi:hypothetical protein
VVICWGVPRINVPPRLISDVIAAAGAITAVGCAARAAAAAAAAAAVAASAAAAAASSVALTIRASISAFEAASLVAASTAADTIDWISLALRGWGAAAAVLATAACTRRWSSAEESCSGTSGAGISEIAPFTICCISAADTGDGAGAGRAASTPAFTAA